MTAAMRILVKANIPAMQGLALMALDIVEEPNGCFYVWGTMTDGGSVLVRLEDFQPYLYIAMPTKQVSDTALLPASCLACIHFKHVHSMTCCLMLHQFPGCHSQGLTSNSTDIT